MTKLNFQKPLLPSSVSHDPSETILMHSAAWKFVNPSEFFIFLHKSDQKDNLVKQMRQTYIYFCHTFNLENDPILHMCEWQTFVNL